MSKKKADSVWQAIYGPHLSGGRDYAYNPSDNELAVYERMYMRILSEMCINRFKWIGLPDEINERFLELTLFRQALSIFYWDNEYDHYMALRGASYGPLNMYDEPTSFRVTGNSTFVGKDLSDKECVPIWANVLRLPDADIVLTYAKRLANMDRTIDINSKNARRTKVIVANENQRHSAANINNEIEKGSPSIWVNAAGMDLLNNLTALDMGVDPRTIEFLQVSRTRMWNDCMQLLGLNYANQDKRERLVADEVHGNDEQVGNMRAVNLNERKRAARAINKMFGLSVDVKYRVDIPTPVENTLGEL